MTLRPWRSTFDVWRARRQTLANARRFHQSFLAKGDLCFDVGANTGDRTKLFRSLGAEVVSVEPQSMLARELEARFKRDQHVHVVKRAISPIEGELPLLLASETTVVATMSQEWTRGRFEHLSWDRTELVSTTTLEDLMNEFGRPKYLKVDVEGYEREVLSTLKRPVEWVSFEFTGEFLTNARLCLELLQNLGQLRVNFVAGELMQFAGPWSEPAALLASLEGASAKDESLWGDIFVVTRCH